MCVRARAGVGECQGLMQSELMVFLSRNRGIFTTGSSLVGAAIKAPRIRYTSSFKLLVYEALSC